MVRRDEVGRGIAFTLLAIFLFATQDAVSKFLMQDHSPFQVAMMRFWAFCAMSVVIARHRGSMRAALRSRAPKLQILRPVLLVVDIWLFMFALQTVPLAELQAITLVYPLIVTLVAIPFLGERVGVFRLSAVLAGFAGALVIVRPGGLPLDFGAFCALASAACYAVYLALTRKVSGVDSTETSLLYVGIVGLALTTAVGVFFWQTPDAASLGLLLYIMFTGCAGHGLIIAALATAPASVLQPFNYTALPWGILFGYLFFGQMIDSISLGGAALIVAAGMVVMARERLKKAPILPPALPGRE
ncbi:MAG TPA: DMT family transporter [Mesorhizobium sp.]|jgi:drug/metabolite transporter (DMT)-like permease|nr:DMT family transporter [Mesorhizobium sp.]